MTNNIEKTIKKFKVELEEVLDEYFPKIEEEGPEKIANKRGQALALYSTAVLLFAQALKNKEKEVVLRIREGVKGIGFSVAHNDYFERGTKEIRNAVLEILETKEVAQEKEKE